MSQQNLEALRKLYQGWAAGDARAGEELIDRHFVYLSQSTDPDPGPHYGQEAASEYYRRVLSSWENWRIEATEIREAGDTFVVRAHRSGLGRDSRAPVDDEAFHVWTFRAGMALRLEVFVEESEALEVAGLQ